MLRLHTYWDSCAFSTATSVPAVFSHSQIMIPYTWQVAFAKSRASTCPCQHKLCRTLLGQTPIFNWGLSPIIHLSNKFTPLKRPLRTITLYYTRLRSSPGFLNNGLKRLTACRVNPCWLYLLPFIHMNVVNASE